MGRRETEQRDCPPFPVHLVIVPPLPTPMYLIHLVSYVLFSMQFPSTVHAYAFPFGETHCPPPAVPRHWLTWPLYYPIFNHFI